MQVIRQDHHGAEGERMFCTNPAYCRAQMVDMIHERSGRPVGQGDGEEIRPARDAIAAVVNHDGSMASPPGRFCRKLATPLIVQTPVHPRSPVPAQPNPARRCENNHRSRDVCRCGSGHTGICMPDQKPRVSLRSTRATSLKFCIPSLTFFIFSCALPGLYRF